LDHSSTLLAREDFGSGYLASGASTRSSPNLNVGSVGDEGLELILANWE
jgi:hypothetical protein